MNQVIKDDLAAIKAEFAIPRRTRIEDGAEAVYVENEISVQEVVFVMDRFGYCKLLDKSTYERNQETVDTEQVHVKCCLNTDKIWPVHLCRCPSPDQGKWISHPAS